LKIEIQVGILSPPGENSKKKDEQVDLIVSVSYVDHNSGTKKSKCSDEIYYHRIYHLKVEQISTDT
jgi:hypothetical protein